VGLLLVTLFVDAFDVVGAVFATLVVLWMAWKVRRDAR
jgi:hypothetical protein